MKSPKILFVDIETAPLLVYTWGIYEQNIGLNQIHTDWSILAWCAKWFNNTKMIYKDQKDAKKIRNDKRLLKEIWQLLNECDILVTQNGKRFDVKKLNAKFIKYGLTPPSSYRHIDTLQISKKYFGFTSHSLAQLAKELGIEIGKYEHKKFPGMELWKQCLKRNVNAWKEMEIYNKQDVLVLEKVYNKLKVWDNTVNFNVYHDGEENLCRCGSISFKKNGFKYTNTQKYQRYKCSKCGHETRGRQNLLTKEKLKSLKV